MIPILTLTHRDHFGDWLNEQGLTGDGAEIGCAFGSNAAIILSWWKGRRLYMIDPWTMQSSETYPEKHDTVDYDKWFRLCEKLSWRDTRAALIKKLSLDGANTILDDSLDFAYIDGNHCYQSISADLEAWWPKVKSGGIMGGHDFYNIPTFPNHCEVERAVREWSEKHNLPIHTTECTSWWIAKN